MKLLYKNRNSATLSQLNSFCFILMYFNKKEEPHIYTFNKQICAPYEKILPTYQENTRASWWKKFTSNWNANRVNN